MKSNIKELFTGCLTIPNLLSVIRIALIPVFGVLYYNGDILWAVVVLFISGLTDFFDGKIARKFNQISALGKMLDPVADKMTQITIAIVLYLTFKGSADETIKAFSWVFLIFLIKEAVMVVGGAIMVAFGLRPCAAEMPGKIATFVCNVSFAWVYQRENLYLPRFGWKGNGRALGRGRVFGRRIRTLRKNQTNVKRRQI